MMIIIIIIIYNIINSNHELECLPAPYRQMLLNLPDLFAHIYSW